jgi:hypothetical protein
MIWPSIVDDIQSVSFPLDQILYISFIVKTVFFFFSSPLSHSVPFPRLYICFLRDSSRASIVILTGISSFSLLLLLHSAAKDGKLSLPFTEDFCNGTLKR